MTSADALSAIAAVAMLGAMGTPGVVFLRCLRSKLDPLEQVAYGFPLGVVATSRALLAAASIAGRLSWELVALATVTAIGLATVMWRYGSVPGSGAPM